jgi:hypothetical protein
MLLPRVTVALATPVRTSGRKLPTPSRKHDGVSMRQALALLGAKCLGPLAGAMALRPVLALVVEQTLPCCIGLAMWVVEAAVDTDSG